MKQTYKPIIEPELPEGSKRRRGKSPGVLNLLPSKWQAKAFMSLLCVLFSAHAFAQDYYVAPAPVGSDANNGLSSTAPFATIGKAAAVARNRVIIAPGTYREQVEIKQNGATFVPRDGAGTVTINGADPMLAWTQAAGSTYSTPMAWDLFTGTGTIAGTSAWKNSNQVFQDGRMIELCRWPKRPAASTDADLVLMSHNGVRYNAIAENITMPNPAGSSAITITDVQFNGDTRWVGAKIWINLARHGHDGNGQTGVVTGISGNTISATINGYGVRGGDQPWGVGADTEYFLFDPAPAVLADAAAVDGMLEQGEWWRNPTNNTLYVKTRTGAAPATAEGQPNLIEAKKRVFAFWPDGTIRSGYNIQGFNLFACAISTERSPRSGGVEDRANGIVLENLTVKYPSHLTDFGGSWDGYHYGSTGIVLSGRNNIIRNCTISYSAVAALSLLGDKSKALDNRLNDNNYMCSSAGAFNTGGLCADVEIARNTIMNTTHMGINIRGIRNSNREVRHQARVHHNEIVNFMCRSYDSGAIDAGVTDFQWIRVDHNKIYNTIPEARIGGRKYGIYFDYGSLSATRDPGRIGTTIDHNVIYDVNNCITVNAGGDVHIFNNVLLTVPTAVVGNPEGSRGLTLGAMNDGAKWVGENVRAYNNIVSEAIYVVYTDPGVTVFNNIMDAKGATVLNELFVDATNPDLAARNYSLKPTATRAIDKGISVAEFTNNYTENEPIYGVPDIGAFEFVNPSAPADNANPSAPALTASSVSGLNGNSFLLSWAPSTDDVEVAYYEVYANNTFIKQTSTPSLQLSSLEGSTSFFMKVLAVDRSGKRSDFSNVLEVKTTAPVPNADIAKTTAAITIDGTREAAWGVTLPITKVFDTPPTSAADLSGNWTALWDTNNLYFFIDVNDDVKVVDSGTGTWYFDDHIELMIDAEGTQPTGYGAKQHQYFMTRAGTLGEAKHPGTSLVGTQTSLKEKPDGSGYQVEIKIPFSTLGVTPQALAIMGIEVQIGDDDDGGNEDTRMGWHSTVNNVYANPSLMGVAKLTAPGIEDDTTPPSTPTGLTSSAIFPTAFTLNWNASTDNLGVYSYEVYLNGNLAGTPKATNITLQGLTEGTTYKVEIRAKDRFNNLSSMSSPLRVITPTKASAVKYESENATFASPLVALNTPVTGFSGTGYVRGMDGNNLSAAVITYTINVPYAGTYSAFMRYANGGTSAMYINGTKVGNFSMLGTVVPNTWEDTYSTVLLPNLNAGNNTIRFQNGESGTSGHALHDYFGVYVPASDFRAPSGPTGLNASNVTDTSFTLNWAAASIANETITGYDVYRDGNLVGSTTGSLSLHIGSLEAGTSYEMAVKSKTASGNHSDVTTFIALTTGTGSRLVTNITVTPEITTSLSAGSSMQLTANITPTDANNKLISWTSSNSFIVSVDNTGKITAVGTGRATITASSTDGSNIKVSIPITVTRPWFKIDDNASGSGIVYDSNWRTWGGNPGYMNTEHYIENKTLLSEATFSYTGSRVRWYGFERPDVGIAHVYLDGVLVDTVDLYNSRTFLDKIVYDSGELPNGSHTLKIKATNSKNPLSTSNNIIIDAFEYSTYTVPPRAPATSVSVTPASASVAAGAQVTLEGTVNPLNADQEVTWSSVNPAIASVANGVVSGWQVGTTTIRATSGDNTKFTDVTITVTPSLVSIDRTNPVGSGLILARGRIGNSESEAKAFDNNFLTSKWLDPVPANTWIQYTFPNSARYAVDKYSITSGNDSDNRDPKTWRLLGTNVSNSTNVADYTEVDRRENYDFTARNQRVEFTVDPSKRAKYATYRLAIDFNNGEAVNTQLNEIELFAPDATTAPTAVNVTPTSANVAEGDSVRLSASVSPSGANQNVRWSSLTSAIASVTNGVVRGLQPGTATIRAASVADSTKFSDVTITVSALPVPVISAGGATTFCPADSVVLTSTEAPAYQWYKGAVALSGQTSRSLTASQSGSYTVEVTYANGIKKTSAATTVNAEDTANPVVLTKNISVQLVNGAAVITAADVDNGSTDNCGMASLALDKTTFSCADAGTQTVTLTATDRSGNTSSATATVTVEEKVKPVVATKNITVQLDATGTATISDDAVNNGSADNCSSAESLVFSTDIKSFSCANVGTPVTVTLTVTDANGNSDSQTATVTVEDKTAPAAVTKNISVALVNGSAVITAADVDNGSADNCGIASMSLNKTSFSCADTGNQTVTLTVTDKGGNTSSATATVTVTGSVTAPAIAVSRTNNTYTGLDPKTIALGYGAQSLTLTASINGSASGTYSWSPAAGLSNAGIANPVFTPSAAGTYTFTVTATSESGCPASASVTIKVIDVRCGNKNNKVLICKKEGTSKAKEGCVGAEDVADQLRNGAKLGGCTTGVIAADGSETSALDLSSLGATTSVRLTSYPNPFANQTTVSFTLPKAEQKVTLAIFDAVGNRIATLYSGKAEANVANEFVFDGSQLPAGAYFARLITAQGSQTFKLIVVK